MTKTMPFQLQDGQKAYAAKLMGNFNFLLGVVDDLNIPGLEAKELNEALAEIKGLIDEKITAHENNARQVRFADGVSLQDKLDNGDLKGADGVTSTSDGMYSFYVGGDGHLYLVTRSQVQGEAFSINDQGHLIYTIGDLPTETGEPKTYDLGNVRASGMSVADYDPTGKKQDIFAYVDQALADMESERASQSYETTMLCGSWAEAPDSVEIPLEQMTASCHFLVGPSAKATEEQRQAWRSGAFSVSAQAAGSFTLVKDGETPQTDIPLSIVILP